MAFTVMFSEEQRVALLALMRAAHPSMDDALEYWVEMLEELPENEAANPGILHGFCL